MTFKEGIRFNKRTPLYILISLSIIFGIYFLVKSLNTSHAGGLSYSLVGNIEAGGNSVNVYSCINSGSAKGDKVLAFQVNAINVVISNSSTDFSIVAKIDSSRPVPVSTTWTLSNDSAGQIDSISNFMITLKSNQSIKIGANSVGNTVLMSGAIDFNKLSSCEAGTNKNTPVSQSTAANVNPYCPSTPHGICHMALKDVPNAAPTYIAFLPPSRIVYLDSGSSFQVTPFTFNTKRIGIYDVNSFHNIEFKTTSSSFLGKDSLNNILIGSALVNNNGLNLFAPYISCTLSDKTKGLSDADIFNYQSKNITPNLMNYCIPDSSHKICGLDNPYQTTTGKILSLNSNKGLIYTLQNINGNWDIQDNAKYCAADSFTPKSLFDFGGASKYNNYLIDDMYEDSKGNIFMVMDKYIFQLNPSYIKDMLSRMPLSQVVASDTYRYTTNGVSDPITFGGLNPSLFSSDIQYLTENPKNHKIYFTTIDGELGVIDPVSKSLSYIPVTPSKNNPNGPAKSYGIVSDSDGNIWFTIFNYDEIAELNYATGKITYISVDFNGKQNNGQSSGYNDISMPFDIIIGPDGNPWFSEYRGNRIGEYLP